MALLFVTTLTLAALTVAPQATVARANPVSAPQALPCPPRVSAPLPAKTTSEKAQPHYPIRAAFYYGWTSRSSHYHPTYGSDDVCAHSDAPKRTVSQMQYAGLNAGIASWMGRGTPSDKRTPAILRGADGTSFRWSLYYEPAGQSIKGIADDLGYISRHYTRDQNYLRVRGKPVLFVWAGGSNNCSLTHRWTSVNKGRFYLVLKDFYQWQKCPYQPSSWHAYGPASRKLSVGAHSYSISPGFWRNTESRPELPRDTVKWAAAVRSMVASKAHWQLVTTFDEWGENTAVESASEWHSSSSRGRYLDLLRQNLRGH
jgi:hypothetical protein